MKKKIINRPLSRWGRKLFLLGMAAYGILLNIEAEPSDSLQHYLTLAAHNNPQVRAAQLLYQAAEQKIPQAGAFVDPELEIGFYPRPMSILAGKQIANFTLMQMFPWFGSRKAAREEAGSMANMAHEQYKNTRNNLSYEVKRQWHNLCNLRAQEKNAEANIRLLEQLEHLARNRYSARVSSAMAAADGGGVMSDVLRIQLERAEVEEKLEEIRANQQAATARFNALLYRKQDLPVTLPDTVARMDLPPADRATIEELLEHHPSLVMLKAEGESYQAKARMDQRMSLPMLGIGVQYMLIGKGDPMAMNPMPDMNGKDMFMPMVKISLPLFRRKYHAQQRESRFNYQANLLQQADTRNQLQANYIDLRQQLSTADRKVKLYEKQEALSRSAYQLMVREFSSGSAALTDVIQVERQLLDYALKKSEAIAAYNTVIAGIEQLLSTHLNEIEDESIQ